MSDPTFVKNLLAEQRKRLVASVMDYIEVNVYPHLSGEEQKALRQRVLTSVGVYHDFCLDAIKASVNDGSIQNEHVLELLRSIHSAVSYGSTKQ